MKSSKQTVFYFQ